MKISVIAIGDELLIGQVTDTNSGMIARHIGPYGWEVAYVQTIGDKPGEITAAIDRAFSQTDVVITTGGLGPTKDDLTKQTLCDYFGGTLVEDPEVTANNLRLFARRGIEMNALTAAQALVPTSCRVIQNRVGTAPIMWFERDGKVLVSMPGVPFETETMLAEAVFPQLLKRFHSDVNIAHAVLMVGGFTESGLAMEIADWEEALPPHLHLAYLPKPGIIRLRIDGIHPDADYINKEVTRASLELQQRLGSHVLVASDLTPPEILLDRCREHGLTIASAESCTGGNIAHQLTLIPGASDVVAGGVVSYSNEVKINVLGVKAETLAANGAVSLPVVGEMAAGVMRLTGASLTMSTSGIAGPGGGTPEKPVGTVCIGARLRLKDGTEVGDKYTAHFNGSRPRVIESATTAAILLAIKLIDNNLK